MKRTDTKSHCPINFALECMGDPWSLLIVRDIVYFGKKTYGEFLESDEHIATNMLAARLKFLQDRGIIVKTPHFRDKRKEVYNLTEKGLDLVPIMMEMASWSVENDPLTAAPRDFIECFHADREGIIDLVRQTVRAGGAVFVGPNSVIEQLTTLKRG